MSAMYRPPLLFTMTRVELVDLIAKRIESIKHSRELVRGAMETETIAHVKEKTFPAAIRALDIEERDAQWLFDHVHPAEAHDLTADEVWGIRESLRTVDVDLQKLRLTINDTDDKTFGARRGRIIPASTTGLDNVLKAAAERNKH